MKTVQLQSKPFSRKAKTPAQDRKAVKASQAAFAAELAQLQAKQAAQTPVVPVAAPAKYSIVNGLFVIQQ